MVFRLNKKTLTFSLEFSKVQAFVDLKILEEICHFPSDSDPFMYSPVCKHGLQQKTGRLT